MSTNQATALATAAQITGQRHGANMASYFDVHDLAPDDALAILDDVGDWLEVSGNAPVAPIDTDERADAMSEIADELDADGVTLDDAAQDAYRTAYVTAYTDAIVSAVADHLRGTPIPAAVTVDGEQVGIDDPEDIGTVHVSIDEEGTAAEPQPLSWCNSASVTLTHTEDEVQVAISVGDPRGAFVMSVRRIPEVRDGAGEIQNRELAGRLVLYAPYPHQPYAHAPLTEYAPGAFLIGER